MQSPCANEWSPATSASTAAKRREGAWVVLAIVLVLMMLSLLASYMILQIATPAMDWLRDCSEDLEFFRNNLGRGSLLTGP